MELRVTQNLETCRPRPSFRSASADKLGPALPFASGALARAAAKRARDAEIDLVPLLRKAGLTQSQIDDPEQRIGARDQVVFVEEVARALGAAHLGLQLASVVDLREMGLLYYVGASAATLGEAARRLARYCMIGNEAIRIGCCGSFELQLYYEGMARHLDRQQMEFFLAIVLRLFRQLSGRDVTPSSVRLTHALAGKPSAYVAAFGRQPEFQAGEDALRFEPWVADLPVLSSDPYLATLLLDYCDDILARRSRAPLQSFRVKVENAIIALLPHGRPQARQIASMLKLSTRTLARHLSNEGVTLSAIIDTMRRDLADRYLADPSLSLAQIAWLLGYGDAGSFSHAFRRWTGRSPRQRSR